MESIEKLRMAAKGNFYGSTGNVMSNLAILFGENPNLYHMNILEKVADSIESEIAEKYMLLPVDADGDMCEIAGANDAPPKGTFQVSHDYGSTFSPPAKIQDEHAQVLERKNAELKARLDELIHAINELQKKQPYCYYNPDKPVETLDTIGRYIDELIVERDEWMAKATEEAANAEDHWKNAKNIMKECDARARALDMQLKNIHNLEHERDELQKKVEGLTSGVHKLLDLAHNAWSIAICAMQGMPIPASWGNAVEKGLREHGIDVDELPYVV